MFRKIFNHNTSFNSTITAPHQSCINPASILHQSRINPASIPHQSRRYSAQHLFHNRSSTTALPQPLFISPAPFLPQNQYHIEQYQ